MQCSTCQMDKPLFIVISKFGLLNMVGFGLFFLEDLLSLHSVLCERNKLNCEADLDL
jgi:hypothetical protein